MIHGVHAPLIKNIGINIYYILTYTSNKIKLYLEILYNFNKKISNTPRNSDENNAPLSIAYPKT
jgi:hypothetical protein